MIVNYRDDDYINTAIGCPDLLLKRIDTMVGCVDFLLKRIQASIDTVKALIYRRKAICHHASEHIEVSILLLFHKPIVALCEWSRYDEKIERT
jgi:hypothetical protein